MSPQALVHAKVESFEGLNHLKQKIINLKKIVDVVKASSAYKRKLREDAGKEYIEIVMQIKGCADGKEYSEVCLKTQVELLIVEGELRLDPELTLPNPNLQLDAFVLHLAAECAPYWEHRVRKKSLLELDQESVVEELAEFLTQGQALINL